MILVSGAGGKTGLAILRALAQKGEHARALVHREGQVDEALRVGAAEAFTGNLLDPRDLIKRAQGVELVYHICPNMHPQELEIGAAVIEAARECGVRRIVYHSVLHPQVEAMPHHWLKMRVEEKLMASGLSYTILQPCAYMQNIQGYWDAILKDGIFPLPYAASARISVVDLEDVAEAAARVLTESEHDNATYELAGPESLSQEEQAAVIASVLNRPVAVKVVDRASWKETMISRGMPSYSVDTLIKMFVYYEENGFMGNPRVLSWLLGRRPHTFIEYIHRVVSGEK